MGLIGEMRKLRGRVSFGGRVAYCAQTAWIQNATLVHNLTPYICLLLTRIQRENITFGQAFDEDRVSNSTSFHGLVTHHCYIPVLESSGRCVSRA